MSNEEWLPRGLNYLGELGSKLRDLRGTATLAHELIQNAEDAIKDIVSPTLEQATITFRIDQRALIVDNGGVFSDCGQQAESICPWKRDGRRSCDFHSFRDVGGAAKRRADHERGQSGGLKGAFGFGFTAVYQVTDHPQLVSNGRHWILEDQNDETHRIRICRDPECEHCSASNLPGTRFILPWAFDASSEVRLGLNAPTVSREKPQELVQELKAALPRTVLFLDHIRQLQVIWEQTEQIRVAVSDRSQPVITVSINGEPVQWALLSYDFSDRAEALRRQHPEGEKVPSSEVKIAVPRCGSDYGLFFAYLPTQIPTGVSFHINADFFPSNDRKHLLLEDDYQGKWNRAAIRAGAIALRNGLLSLRSHLAPKGFWELVRQVHHVAAENDSLLGMDYYWTKIQPVLQNDDVIPASDGNWYPVSDVRFVSQQDHNRYHALYAELGIKTVNPLLEEYQSFLTSADIGVRRLDLGLLASKLLSIGLSNAKSLEQLPRWLQRTENRELLWRQIGEVVDFEMVDVLQDQENSPLSLLEQCAIVECNDGMFRTICDSFTADESTVTLFQSLCPDLNFVKDNPLMIGALECLVPKFLASDALDALSRVQELHELRENDGQQAIPEDLAGEFLAWFNERIGELRARPLLIAKLKTLAICPTGGGLQPFDDVVLPGGFSDPSGVTSVADLEKLRPVWPLVELLELGSLSLSEYVVDRLPNAFQKYEFEEEACRKLLVMLAQHQGELFDSEDEEDVRSTLSGLDFVLCSDGKLRCVDDGLYFADELTKKVLANSVIYVAESICTAGIERFLEWLGVANHPRLDQVVDYMIKTAKSAESPTQPLMERMLTLFEHVAGRHDELDANYRLRERLKSHKWLPAITRHWDADAQQWRSKGLQWAAPGDLHHHGCRHLVETVASFVEFAPKVQNAHRAVLKSLGMVVRPKAKTVLKHLYESSKMGSPIGPEVYEFLNSSLKDSELYPADFHGLKNLACLRLRNAEGERFVKPKACFSQEHPFRAYRVLLDSHVLTTMEELLTALEIRPRPTWTDAVEVLHELAQGDDARLKRKLSRDNRKVVIECWRLIETALRDEEISTDLVCSRLEKLAMLHVVCRADNLLDQPAKVFFRDQEHFAEAFSGILDAELIGMPLGATEALTLAGVRRLSEVTTARIDHDETNQRDAEKVASRIRERAELLVKVVETCRSNRSKMSLPNFNELKVLESASLTVELTFHGYDRPLPPVRQSVSAAVEKSPDRLWYCMDDGDVPWDAIACQLARLCLDTQDVAQLSPSISAAIEPDSLRRAQRKLSRLGFPSIEVSDEESEPTEPAVTFGLHGSTLLGEDSHDGEFSRNERDEGTVAQGHMGQSSTSPPAIPSIVNRPSGQNSVSSSETAVGKHPQSNIDGRQERTPMEGSLKSGERLIVQTNPSSHGEARFVDWLAAQPGASDRRKQKIQELSSDEPRRSSEYMTRRQRVNRIPKEDVFRYLADLYSSDGVLNCQMRTEDENDLHGMPFRKKDGELYWGKEELFNRQLPRELIRELPEDARLHLLLCPTCAAVYAEFIGTQPHQQRKLMQWINSETDQAVFEVECSLNGRQPRRFLHFHPRHLDDIRSVDGVSLAADQVQE